MDLRGNVALVAGVAGPVGAAVSARLAGLGASVAVLDRRPDAVAHRIAGDGGHVLALTADAGDSRSLRAALGRLLSAWERVDIVVTGAGSMATVGPAVARYLSESARTSTRGVADLVVLTGAADCTPGELRELLTDQLVRVSRSPLPDGLLADEFADEAAADTAEQVLRLIGRPVPAQA